MASLADRRRQVAMNAATDYIKFEKDGESRILRFLFDTAENVPCRREYFNTETQQWEYDRPDGLGSVRVTFTCVEYDKGGANPRIVKFKLSAYLYDEYLAPYIEKNTPARNTVWEITARRPKTMDVSYVAYPIADATPETYPIPEGDVAAAPVINGTPTTPAAPTYATTSAPTPVQQPAPEPAAQTQQAVHSSVVQSAPAQAPTQAPKRNKYF